MQPVAGAGARPLRPPALVVATLALALCAWAVTVDLTAGMDMGPGTDLGALPFFLGIWVTMMAAMMLPSAMPMVLLFREAADSRRTWVFLGGYLAAWSAYGLVAFGLARSIRAADPAFLSWHREGPLVAGTALVAAAAYQLTPLKRACLRHCRTPLAFLTRRWRDGRLGALRMGVEHGSWCVGCCGGLMVILFALGAMSLVWMIVVSALVFAEKIAPRGERLAPAIAAALLGAGLWVAVEPGSFPGLVQPR